MTDKRFEKNELVEVIINDIGDNGEGIGHIEGYTLFVKDALPGDTVKAKILKAKKGYAYARMEEIITPSLDRCDPVCPVSRSCGGCQLQSYSYEAQLQFKAKKVRDALKRIGGFEDSLLDKVMNPIVGMNGDGETPYRYRNKAQYPVAPDADGRAKTGFYAAHSHNVIKNDDCVIEPEINSEILGTIITFINDNNIEPYNEENGTGLVRHILIRHGRRSGEILICIVINGHDMKGAKDLAKILCEKYPAIKTVSLNSNTERTNVITGPEVMTICGSGYIRDSLRTRDMSKNGYPFTGEERIYNISPLSFYQVNPIQTEKLYSIALSYAGLTGKEIVWDLYCGVGTISLFMAGHAGKVYGVEIIPEAIADAKENAKLNSLDNAEFIVGKAEEIAPTLPAPDVIVVDPPRKGCDIVCLETILKNEPERIVYVSCDPATLARDLKILCEDGRYEIREVTPVDQFAMGVHVEVVSLLQRVSNTRPKAITLDVDMEDYYRIKRGQDE